MLLKRSRLGILRGRKLLLFLRFDFVVAPSLFFTLNYLILDLFYSSFLVKGKILSIVDTHGKEYVFSDPKLWKNLLNE